MSLLSDQYLEILLKVANMEQSKEDCAFYWKAAGDYNRYKAEILEDEEREICKKLMGEYYDRAQEYAMSNPVR